MEVGPHPALRGPADETNQNIFGKSIPYVSTLGRGHDAINAISTSLGLLWQYLQPDTSGVPNLDKFEKAMLPEDKHLHRFKIIKGLPSYQWNHTTQYWAESRVSRKTRLRNNAYHPLIGHETSDSSRNHLIWKNLLR